MKKFHTLLILLLFTQLSRSSTYVVTNTNDNGNGSLRWAINQWIYSPDPDTITFNIPTGDPGYNAATGLWTISPDSTLPYIVKSTVIDATTQTSNQGNTNPNGPEIMINGQNLLDFAFCILTNVFFLHLKSGICKSNVFRFEFKFRDIFLNSFY